MGGTTKCTTPYSAKIMREFLRNSGSKTEMFKLRFFFGLTHGDANTAFVVYCKVAGVVWIALASQFTDVFAKYSFCESKFLVD